MIDDRVFFSGDTKLDPDLVHTYADRSEAMFHDVKFFPGAVHAPLNDLYGFAPEIKDKMYLVHYADSYENQGIIGFAGWAKQGQPYVFKGQS